MLIALSILISMFSIPQSQQDLDCELIRYGKFKIDQILGDSTVTTYLERKGDIQFERNYQFGLEYKFKVDWVDDCTYTLTLIETIRDDNNFNYPENELITVRVKEIFEEYYIHVTHSRVHDMEFESKVYIMK